MKATEAVADRIALAGCRRADRASGEGPKCSG